MASILKVLESQNLKKCDKDLGGCDRPGTPFRKLNAVPDVFTLLMAWEENVPGKDIKETLDLVDVEVMKFAGTRGGVREQVGARHAVATRAGGRTAATRATGPCCS